MSGSAKEDQLEDQHEDRHEWATPPLALAPISADFPRWKVGDAREGERKEGGKGVLLHRHSKYCTS